MDVTPTSSAVDLFTYTSMLTLSEHSVPAKDVVFGACRHVNEFDKKNRLGEGTYGVVYKGYDTLNKEVRALKKIRARDGDNGISEMTLRELLLLKELKHENIVELIDVAVPSDLSTIFLVMEYCSLDLATVTEGRAYLLEMHIKCLMKQLLRGLRHIHERFIIHRDLKLSNLLIDGHGVLKIADFGLARIFGDPNHPMTPRVVTLWYRSPEVLLGSRAQEPALDMWSAGCIFGQLVLGRPMLPGRSETDQLLKMFSLLGTPTLEIWPDMKDLPLYNTCNFPKVEFRTLKKVFSTLTPAGIDLLDGLLLYDPKRRVSARIAADHAYFSEAPEACLPKDLPFDFENAKPLTQ